jgi:hypothetical protein
LILGVLEAANKIITLNDETANRAIVLVANTRAALFVQQVKRDVLTFGRSVNPDRNRYESKRQDASTRWRHVLTYDFSEHQPRELIFRPSEKRFGADYDDQCLANSGRRNCEVGHGSAPLEHPRNQVGEYKSHNR